MHQAGKLTDLTSGNESKTKNANQLDIEGGTLTIANFNEHLLIPHQYELMRFFEHFHMMRYPREPIMMLRRKCKVSKVEIVYSFNCVI
jgi:hypothetical protein